MSYLFKSPSVMKKKTRLSPDGKRASEGVLSSIDAILAASDPALGTPFSPSNHSRGEGSKKGLSLSNHSKGLSISSDHSRTFGGSTHSRDISSHSRGGGGGGLDMTSDHSIGLSLSNHSKDWNESDPSLGLSMDTLDEQDELLEDDELLPEEGDTAQTNTQLAKQLMEPPKASPGVFKKRKTLKKSRKNKMREGKKMGGSLSVIETLLGHNADDIEDSPLKKPSSISNLDSPSSLSTSKRRKGKGRKQTLIEALKESRHTLPPFQQSEDEDEEIEVLVKSAPTKRRARRRASANSALTSDSDTNSMRQRKISLASSQFSEMPSSVRKGRSTVETSSRRSRRTVDGDGNSSRRSRRTVDTGDGNSSRRSRRTIDTGDGNNSRRSRRTVDTSADNGNSTPSRRTVDTSADNGNSTRSRRTVDGDGNSSRRSRRTIDSDDGSTHSTRKSRTLKSGRKKKSKKNKDSKKSKRKSTESMASNSTSVTTDMDASWTSLREDSQREELHEDQQQQQQQRQQDSPRIEEEQEEGEYQLPIEEEEREYELPLPEEDEVGSGTLFASSLGSSIHSYSSCSSLDLSEDEDEDELIAEDKKQELRKFMRTDSLGALNRHGMADDSDDDDDILVGVKEEVAGPPSRRSLMRQSRSDSRRGLSCGAGKRDSARGREKERASKQRGFSVSPERHLHEMMMERERLRPLLSCMKGSRGKLLNVKLKNPHVYFNECLVITPIIPTYELASKKSDLWFRQKDFDKILNRSMAIALRVKEGKKTKKCVRGLEHFLKDKEERYAAWNAVLIEQEIQNLSGKHSDEKISKKYLEASTTCRSEAQEIAQSDYDAIVQYILEDT